MRTQLSLFVPALWGTTLEAIRRRVDPVQARLIPAHVTLCRDTDLTDLAPDLVRARIADAPAGPLTLAFGPAQRFGGHGLLLPCIAGEPDFVSLRRTVLGRTPSLAQSPHLTLAHPRNPMAPGNSPCATAELPTRVEVRFTSVQWIEQHDAGPWVVRHSFDLGVVPRP